MRCGSPYVCKTALDGFYETENFLGSDTSLLTAGLLTAVSNEGCAERTCWSNTFWKCLVRLRSGEVGDQSNTVKYSCFWSYSHTTCALWEDTLSCWKILRNN